MRAAPLQLLLLAGVCATLQDGQYLAMEFSTKIKHNEICELCYGTDCLSMDETRCQYYRRTENILQNRTEKLDSNYNEIIINKIDAYLIEYVQEGSQIYNYYDCIPLISQYTNCYRENICTGCQTCNCDGMGQWNCTMVNRCDTTEDFSRGRSQSLATVMEELKAYINMFQEKKTKRSMNYDNEKEQEQIKYDDIVHFENNNKINTTEEVIVNQSNISNLVDSIDSYVWDTEHLGFEEFPNTINSDNIMTQTNITISQDKSDDVNFNNINSENLNSKRKKRVSYKLTPRKYDFIDIFVVNSSHFFKCFLENILDMKSVNLSTFDYQNNFNDNETRSFKKRETELKINKSQWNYSTISDNSSPNITELKNSVLYPLFNIVNKKQKELEQLIRVEEKLVIYFKSFSNTSKVTNSSELNDDPYLYFYKLETPSESKDDTRRSKHQPNTRDIKEKYLKLLKQHLFEVTRDIVNIQRLFIFSTMPHELKVLIQAVKYYFNKGKRNNKGIGKKLPTTFNFRRQLLHLLHAISNIFESVDNTPVTNILKSFSPKAKQILQRIINQFYKNDVDNSKIFDPEYDIGKVLVDMGNGWNKISESVIKSPLSDHLYCMKLLHLEVSANIDKIKVALKYLQIAGKRRIQINEDNGGEKIISKMENDLNHINQRIERINQLQVLERNLNKDKSAAFRNKSQATISLMNKNKTKTFLQTIKKLLRKSKKEIRDLFRKKLPKSDIVIIGVDEMTKNKLTDHEEIIERWQNNLNVRNKRSANENESFYNRLKNIIPHYLRGKVNHKKRGNKTNSVGKKRSHRGHKGTKTSRIRVRSTTPVM